MNDPVATYFEKLPRIHRRQFVETASGASLYFQTRLRLTCELASGSTGRLLDCAAGTGEITCALLRSGKFHHATVVDVSPAMLQSAKELLTSEVTNAELEFVQSDVFKFNASEPRFDLVLCLGFDSAYWTTRHFTTAFEIDADAWRANDFADNLIDHFGTRIARPFCSRREVAQRGYRVSWFSERDIMDACRDAGLRILQKRRHSVGIPFGDRMWPKANFQLETRLQSWASRYGADAIYLLEAQ